MIPLMRGDCLDCLKGVPDASVDAVVTDPPYNLAFMGRDWDKHETPLAFQRWCQAWAEECLRVLKPGGHLLAFGGTRTYHRLASGIEDAGFQVRDTLAYMYGSGFPKSHDVSKAIDKAAGAEREVVGRRTDGRYAYEFKGTANRPTGAPAGSEDAERIGGFVSDKGVITAPATEDAAKWEGWGTALKPAHEPIVLARKPLKGTVAANVAEHGTGALNIDGNRIEHQTVAGGNLAENPHLRGRHKAGTEKFAPGTGSEFATREYETHGEGRWPANVLLDEEAAAILDEQAGEARSAGKYDRGSRGPAGPMEGAASIPIDGLTSSQYDDAGGPSRFFYTAKASRAEREAGLTDLKENDRFRTRRCTTCGKNVPEAGACGCPDAEIEWVQPKAVANVHPTVKPIDLMRWLVRLVTPPNGVVLDPFCGSGTTGIAAHLEHARFIGIERDPEYAEIAEARIEWWSAQSGETDEILRRFGVAEKVEAGHRDRGQLDLLSDL